MGYLIDSGRFFVRVSSRVVPALLVLFLCVSALPASAQDEDYEDTETVTVMPLSEQAEALPRPTDPDTVRTNIWLTQALMGEIVTRASRVLPAAPAAVRLVQTKRSDADDLFKEAMVRVLGGQGYTVYLAGDDEARLAAVDHVITFQVVGVELEYPDVGRTLGIWRQWVARELTVSAQVEISAADSGRLLLSDRISRSFSDRIADGDFDHVDSSLYDFTTADTSESGWQRRIEEIVVLGTLAGLVAVYFANTAD